MKLNHSIEVTDRQATVTLTGDVALESTSVIRDAIQAALARADLTTVVVDLAGVTFLDSSALGVLVAARKSSRARGVTFGVRSPGPMVTMVLKVTGLFDELILNPVPENPVRQTLAPA